MHVWLAVVSLKMRKNPLKCGFISRGSVVRLQYIAMLSNENVNDEIKSHRIVSKDTPYHKYN